ncbi:MAG: flagellar hook-associated protein FlgK [Candidatus Gastranaerophilales bacterium]|nr:flagellar hook-associated protein FlgK [Candidatus Gastranaerophilales bacterium]
MSLVSSLNIAQQALSVNQAAITVISNNIANVDNENYSKLRVELADVINYDYLADPTTQANSLNGVQISQIKRYSNAYLQSYYWSENSTASYYEKYAQIASNIEDIVNELNDTGLSNALSKFYDAVNALNETPTDKSARENFVSCAENVCSVLNSYYNSLTNIKENLVGDYQTADSVQNSEIGNNIKTVNDLLDRLANVNENLLKTGTLGISSNSLLDERDALISELSSYINIDVDLQTSGAASVSLGSYRLVNGSEVVGYLDAATGTASKPAQINIVNSEGTTLYADINNSITGGKIGSILDICGSSTIDFTISGVIDQLNTIAQSFANIMNDIQTGDPEGDGTTALCLNAAGTQLILATENIFLNSETGLRTNITAGNISMNSAIIADSNLVAAARVTISGTTPLSYYQDDIGNNANSTLILASRDTTYSTTTYTPSVVNLGGQTLEGYLATFASTVGYDVDSINNSLSTQATVLNEIESQLQSETGVNLDEELSDLIKFQRAYEAAARVFSTCNELLEELINLGR